IFASKHFKGYEIMKEIMAKESSEQDQGIASFGYYPATKKHQLLFEFLRPLSDLEELLFANFRGESLPMHEIYMRHNVGKPSIKSNYKKALISLESKGKITAEPPATTRPRRHAELPVGDNVIAQFTA